MEILRSNLRLFDEILLIHDELVMRLLRVYLSDSQSSDSLHCKSSNRAVTTGHQVQTYHCLIHGLRLVPCFCLGWDPCGDTT